HPYLENARANLRAALNEVVKWNWALRARVSRRRRGRDRRRREPSHSQSECLPFERTGAAAPACVDLDPSAALTPSRAPPRVISLHIARRRRRSRESLTMAAGSLFSTVPELMEWGLRGPALSRRRAAALKLTAILGFLALWSLVSAAVVVAKLFKPIFLPGPWMIAGSLVTLAAKGQLWGHVVATLQRVALGFTTGALLAVGIGLPAGHFRFIRNMVEPVVEMLRPIPPLAMLPLFIVWVGIG